MALAGVAGIIWTMNSCINPVVYASTIPAFRERIKAVFRCNQVKINSKRSRHSNNIIVKCLVNDFISIAYTIYLLEFVFSTLVAYPF